ncbi:MAG TPA: hypothetical protein VM030_03125 [Acidimicrobiales bacterium]|nr:hypothetical protein [Acidimicrobiales bacterium]
MFGIEAVGAGLLGSAFALGLRHGFDVDHLAAITDIAGTERAPRRAFGLATVYALAHGVVVLALGAAAVLAGGFVPPSLDEVMGRIAGVTLLAMGVYVLLGLARHGGGFRARSRWALVLDGLAAARRRLQGRPTVVEFEHDHPHDHRRAHGHDHPDRAGDLEPATVAVAHRHLHRHRGVLPTEGYRWPAVAGIGVLHAIGAETPTQVLLFVAAAGAGGAAAGLPVLACFVGGLLVANTAVAAVATAGMRAATRHRVATGALTALAGAFSVVVGSALLLG